MQARKTMPVGADCWTGKNNLSAARTGGIENDFVEMNLPKLMEASVPTFASSRSYLEDLSCT